MTADLSALIARLEAAEAGSLELDEAISKACMVTLVYRWSQSLDAALTLAERTGFGDCLDIQLRPGTARVSRFDDGRGVWVVTPDCATPALALCIAVLRAKQGEGE